MFSGEVWCLQKTKGASATNVFWAIIFSPPTHCLRSQPSKVFRRKAEQVGSCSRLLLSHCSKLQQSHRATLQSAGSSPLWAQSWPSRFESKCKNMLASDSRRRKNCKHHVNSSRHPLVEWIPSRGDFVGTYFPSYDSSLLPIAGSLPLNQDYLVSWGLRVSPLIQLGISRPRWEKWLALSNLLSWRLTFLGLLESSPEHIHWA